MSKQALHDAFMAGWHYAALHKAPTSDLGARHFEAWYRNASATGTREPPMLAGIDFAAEDEPRIRYFGEPGGAGGTEVKLKRRKGKKHGR